MSDNLAAVVTTFAEPPELREIPFCSMAAGSVIVRVEYARGRFQQRETRPLQSIPTARWLAADSSRRRFSAV